MKKSQSMFGPDSKPNRWVNVYQNKDGLGINDLPP
jgi:hypothetical protein